MTQWAGRRVLLFLATVVLVAASCGGADETPRSSTSATPTETSAPGSAAATTTGVPAGQQTIEVGSTAFYQGYVWTVDTAAIGPGPSGVPTVQVTVSIANPGNRNGQPNAQIALESAGKSYTPLRTGMSQIDAGGQLDTELEFQVDASFDLNAASLVLGAPENNQARIGFGSAEDDSVLRAPVAAGVATDNAPSPLLVAISQVNVRWDDPLAYAQSASGTAYLSVTFSLSSEASTTFAKRNMELTLPDGSTLEPESSPNDRVDGGVEYPNITAIFLVPNPPSGDYTFSMTGMIGYVGETFSVEFSVP